MSARNGGQRDPADMAQIQSRESELSQAQGQAQSTAQQAANGPLVDLHDDGAAELLDRLTDLDVESSEFTDLESFLKPYLSQMLMLAAHDEDYHSDLGNELLNENLYDRLLVNRRRGRYQTGPFLDVIQDIEHDHGPTREPLDPHTREAARNVIVKLRTAMQSQGRETFFKGLVEMHVSTEVRRDDNAPTNDGGGGLLSAINPWSSS